MKTYLLSLPERLVRSMLGLGAGTAREVSEIVLPDAVRGSQLYKNLVDATLRFVIERVGGVEGVYGKEGALPENFLVRRTAGNAVEVLGIVAFRASPVWVLAALADVCGAGRQLIPEMADALKQEGLLDKEVEFTSVDQLLDGLERTSSRLAATINTPPLDVASLRQEWEAVRNEARSLQPESLPTGETIAAMWTDLKTESARHNRSIFETSSMMALSAIRAFPDRARWFYASARVGAARTGEIVAASVLNHYRETLAEMRETGYATFAAGHFRPYLRAAVDQFSPKRQTWTERLLLKFRAGLMLVLLSAASLSATQATPPADLALLIKDARAEGVAARWCAGEFRAKGRKGYAVALTPASGNGRYVVLERGEIAVELASFTGAPDLSCYTPAEARKLSDSIRRSDTISGAVLPQFATTVVCGFVEDTRANCWQYSPKMRVFVQVGEWQT